MATGKTVRSSNKMKPGRFNCIDGHTCGNPVRLVTSGVPLLKGENMFERRKFFIENYDWIRRGLMFEPRGHDMMSGSMLYPPADEKNDIGVLFIETSGCLPMCGHGLIGTLTMAIEEGLISPKTPGIVRVETPAGLVVAKYQEKENKVESVRFTNVPSFLHSSEIVICLSEMGYLKFQTSIVALYP